LTIKLINYYPDIDTAITTIGTVFTALDSFESATNPVTLFFTWGRTAIRLIYGLFTGGSVASWAFLGSNPLGVLVIFYQIEST
jgi:hypothetical protein